MNPKYDGTAAATYAIVIDTVADILPPGGPAPAVRLLMKQQDAQELWHALGEIFG